MGTKRLDRYRNVGPLGRALPHGANRQFSWWIVASVLLGAGTAMVYPSLIAAVSDAAHPGWRARALSVYRFWRDLGYAIGALSAGLIADWFGYGAAIIGIGAITFVSGAIATVAMHSRIGLENDKP